MNGINNAITSVAKNHIITLSGSVELVPSALSGAPIDHRLHFNPVRRRFSTIRLSKYSTSNRLEVLNTRTCEFLQKIETLKLLCFWKTVIWTERNLIVISTTIKSSVSAAKFCLFQQFLLEFWSCMDILDLGTLLHTSLFNPVSAYGLALWPLIYD